MAQILVHGREESCRRLKIILPRQASVYQDASIFHPYISQIPTQPHPIKHKIEGIARQSRNNRAGGGINMEEKNGPYHEMLANRQAAGSGIIYNEKAMQRWASSVTSALP